MGPPPRISLEWMLPPLPSSLPSQGMAAVWRPPGMPFPELSVRSDIIIKGARLEDAVRIFMDQVWGVKCGISFTRTSVCECFMDQM